MPDRSRTIVVLALVAGILLAIFAVASRGGAAASGASGVRDVTSAERAATLTFAPGTNDYDKQAVLTAISHARPEARRLLDIVDGLTDVEIGLTPPGVVGEAMSDGNRYRVVFNLGLVARRGGQRGIDRVVLHELGHIVDFALVPDAIRDQMDATVPKGFGCEDGVTGACTAPEEVFADSFAKWATGDIGVGLSLAGYRIPPPSDLATWGEPLNALGQ
jgi:hypothetical protein